MGGRAATYDELFQQGLKRCTRCEEIKPLVEFSPRSEKSGDLLPRAKCKPCSSDYTIERRDVGYNRRKWLRSKYGLTEDEYTALLAEQGGRCAICRRPGGVDRMGCLRVDHDHATEQVRGLLCLNCNTALGHFGDSIEVLRAAISYLEKHK